MGVCWDWRSGEASLLLRSCLKLRHNDTTNLPAISYYLILRRNIVTFLAIFLLHYYVSYSIFTIWTKYDKIIFSLGFQNRKKWGLFIGNLWKAVEFCFSPKKLDFLALHDKRREGVHERRNKETKKDRKKKNKYWHLRTKLQNHAHVIKTQWFFLTEVLFE